MSPARKKKSTKSRTKPAKRPKTRANAARKSTKIVRRPGTPDVAALTRFLHSIGVDTEQGARAGRRARP